MRLTCAGTVLQFIDSTSTVGKDWLWFGNLNGPLDASNPVKVYPKCVSAFDIPGNRQITGDTIGFTYQELVNPPGLICAIGGLPNAHISVKSVKNK